MRFPVVFLGRRNRTRTCDPCLTKKKAGIVDFTFHDLRHTFASHLAMEGVDITTVSRLLGHASLTMPLRYAHLAPKHMGSAVNVLSKKIGG